MADPRSANQSVAGQGCVLATLGGNDVDVGRDSHATDFLAIERHVRIGGMSRRVDVRRSRYCALTSSQNAFVILRRTAIVPVFCLPFFASVFAEEEATALPG